MDIKLVTAEQLAHSINVSLPCIRKWTKQNSIPYYKLGRAVRFNTQEIQEWLITRRITAINRGVYDPAMERTNLT